MYTIKKIDEDSRISINRSFDTLLAKCYKYSNLRHRHMEQCCNSIYHLIDVDTCEIKGIIACRRIISSDIDDRRIMRLKPQKYSAIYKVEALHYDKDIPNEEKIKLIETCFQDKNDSFTIFEVKCNNVLADLELLQSVGFTRGYSDDKRFILIRIPTTPIRKRIFKKFKY